jgi:transposase-like protein
VDIALKALRRQRRSSWTEAGHQRSAAEAFWPRCYAHFLRNALAYLPRKVADDCLIELRNALRSTQR